MHYYLLLCLRVLNTKNSNGLLPHAGTEVPLHTLMLGWGPASGLGAIDNGLYNTYRRAWPCLHFRNSYMKIIQDKEAKGEPVRARMESMSIANLPRSARRYPSCAQSIRVM